MRQRDWLAAQGWLYPDCGRAPLPTASQHRFLAAPILMGEGGTQARDAMAGEIAASGLPAALISEEILSHDPARAIAFLAPLGARLDLHVVIVLRRADLWAERMYGQAVRGGYGADFAVFLEAEPTRARLSPRRAAAPWIAAFGRDRVHLLSYPEGGDIVPAFLSALGLAAPPGPPAERRNASLPGEAIAWLAGLPPIEARLWPAFNARYGAALAEVCDGAPFVGLDRAGRARLLAAQAPEWCEVFGGDLPSAAAVPTRTTLPTGTARRAEVARAVAARAGLRFRPGAGAAEVEAALIAALAADEGAGEAAA